MHVAKIGHTFDFEKAKSVDHGSFNGKPLMKEALHSGPQASNQRVSLQVQYQAIQIKANRIEERQVQDGDRLGAHTDTLADKALM